MLYSLQVFKSVSNNHVKDSIELSEWVSMLKGSEHTESIKDARKGVKDYTSTKTSLPCINYPFIFKDYKKNSNIVDTTGLLYFDIDDPRFSVSDLNLEQICLLHKSFGGVGYCIVVRVSGMNQLNYRWYYEEVARDLGIEEYVDYNAAKQVQTNVLSYDENVYYNNNSKVFTKHPPRVSILNKKEEREKHIEKGGGQNRKRGFCFSNIELFNFEENDYYVDWFNIKHIRCHIPTVKKGKGKRNNMLLAFAANFMVLNPGASKKSLLKMLEVVDKKGCVKSVGEERLLKIAESILKYKREGTLKPILSKNRSIIFNSEKRFSVEEKREIIGLETKKFWKIKSCEKIQGIIDGWNFEKLGKISGRKIHLNNPISKKTVEKYYKFFKDDIKKINEKFVSKK